jgi:hypothetical protein
MRTVAACALVLCGCSSGKDEPTDGTGTPQTDTDTTDADTDTDADSDTDSDADTDTPTDTAPETEPHDPLTVDVTGWVYAVRLADANWVEPVGFGALIATLFGGTEILVSPTSVEAAEIEMLGAFGSSGIQELCYETVPFPAATWTDPDFDLTAASIDLTVSGFVLPVIDARLSGTFSPTGDQIGDGELSGSLDTRGLAEALGLGTAEGAVCEFIATFGVSCVACPDGEPYCLELGVIDIVAPNLPGTTLVERTVADIVADPTCQ